VAAEDGQYPNSTFLFSWKQPKIALFDPLALLVQHNDHDSPTDVFADLTAMLVAINVVVFRQTSNGGAFCLVSSVLRVGKAFHNSRAVRRAAPPSAVAIFSFAIHTHLHGVISTYSNFFICTYQSSNCRLDSKIGENYMYISFNILYQVTHRYPFIKVWRRTLR
jgi:hypothetical protein